MSEKVKEVQTYLENHGIIVSETTMVDTAIDLFVRRNGLGLYAFVRALEKTQNEHRRPEERH